MNRPRSSSMYLGQGKYCQTLMLQNLSVIIKSPWALSQPRDEIRGFILKSFYCGSPRPMDSMTFRTAKHRVF